MAKKVEFDIVGNDEASGALRDVGRSANRLQGTLGRLGTGTQRVLRPIVALAAAGSTLTSVAGPMAAGLAKVAVSGAHLVVALAPLAATIPGLVGGFFLLKRTMPVVGASMAEALVPIPNYLTKIEKPVARLAAKGLTKLAEKFVKLNGPEIASGMERIAKASNKAAVGFGKWANSVPGQKAIKTIVEGTAKATEHLAPHVTALAISLGNLVTRAGDEGFKRLGDGLATAADAAKRMVDNISVADIDAAWKAFDRVGDSVGKLPDKFRELQNVLKEGTQIWRDNAGAIDAAHWGLTGVAVVAGILTGQWIPALVTGGALLATNFSGISDAVSMVGGWFDRLVASSSDLSGALASAQLTGDTWGSTFTAIGRQLGPLLSVLMDSLRELGPTASESLRLAMPAIRAFGSLLLKFVGAAIATTILGLAALALVVKGALDGFNILAKGIGYAIKGILNFVSDLVGGLGKAISAIPGPFEGIGRQMQNAANEVHNQAREVQNYIDGIHGKTVDINVVTNFKTGKGTASASTKVGYRAAGGPVQAGRPYVVGEAGRELFIPKSDGRILSAARTKAAASHPMPLSAPRQGASVVEVHLHNSGPIGSPVELENWLVRGLDALQSKGRLRLRSA